MQITLTQDIEKALNWRAQRAGIVPEQLALELLRQQLVDWQTTQTDSQDNLAVFLAEHIGSIHSSEYQPGGACLSEKTGKRFAELMMKKRAQGR